MQRGQHSLSSNIGLRYGPSHGLHGSAGSPAASSRDEPDACLRALTGSTGLVAGVGPQLAITVAALVLGVGYVALADPGVNWTCVFQSTPWGPRHNEVALEFNSKLWLLGGLAYAPDRDPGTGAWCSADGVRWTRTATDVPWTTAWANRNTGVVYQGKMWVMGGGGVWTSSDGEQWTQVTNSAPWGNRSCHTSVTFGDRIWLLGGLIGGECQDDVWSSADGVQWDLVADGVAWGVRSDHASVVFDGKIWVLGGMRTSYAEGPLGDVWCSADGVSWSEVTGAAAWPARCLHACLVQGGRMWVLGGSRPSGSQLYFNDVWWSTDGQVWQQATPSAPWPASQSNFKFVAASFQNRMWVLDPERAWRSGDGATWQAVTALAPWGRRARHGSCVAGGRMWIVGRDCCVVGPGDTWSSPDGVHWTQTDNSRGTKDSCVLGFDDKIWVIGGYRSGAWPPPSPPAWPFGANVFSSPDGSTWTVAGLSGRPDGGVGGAVVQGKMWIAGGVGDDPANPEGPPVYMDRALWSADGQHWEGGAEQAFLACARIPCVGFDNKFWALRTLSGVWCTEDGNHWTQASAWPPWAPRIETTSVVAGGRMWVLGGYGWGAADCRNDVWYSYDGANWTQATEHAPWYPRWGHTSIVFDNKIWVIGGKTAEGAYLNDVWYTDLAPGEGEGEGEPPCPYAGIINDVNWGQGPLLAASINAFSSQLAALLASLGMTQWTGWDVEGLEAVIDGQQQAAGDGLPDAYQMALLEYILCHPNTWYHNAVQADFDYNKGLFAADMTTLADIDPNFASLGGLDTLFPGMLGSSQAMRTTVNALVLYLTQGATGLPSLAQYRVFGLAKAAPELLAADGDLDGDGMTNVEEYNWVKANAGGSMAKFVQVATDPFLPPRQGMPIAGIVGLGLLVGTFGVGGLFLLRKR